MICLCQTINLLCHDGKKYQLVAWTRNVTDPENARLNMIPSLEWEMQEPYFRKITRCQQEGRDYQTYLKEASCYFSAAKMSGS